MKRVHRILPVLQVAALLSVGAVADAAAPAPAPARPGGPLSALLGAIDQTVQDPQRAERVKALVRDLSGEMRATQHELRARYLALRQMAFRYETGREELDRAVDELDRLLVASARRFVDVRTQIKELLRPEEWRSLAERILALRPGVLRQ
ncbi:MAG: hypothetical protein ACE147_16890 [Candidatus Methylomirabilales bacterium]